MEIKKFVNSDFGSLTTLKSEKTGKIMFIGKEVAEQWGHTNLRQATIRLLNKDEKLLVKKRDFPDFFNQLVCNNLLHTKVNSILLVSESGLYKLCLASNLDKAQPFKDWVTQEVLPSIREKGSYSFDSVSIKELSKQTIREIQVDNSKKVNSLNYTKGGVPSIIDYNRSNCKQVTGLEPSQIKKIAKQKNKSAKEILRETNPELAATMSLNDHFVNNGAKLEQLVNLDKSAITLFKEIGKLGFTITE